MYYCAANRADIKEAIPEASFGEISKLTGIAWKALSDDDKVEYNKKAEEDKLRYQNEMEGYTPPDDEDGDSTSDETLQKPRTGKFMLWGYVLACVYYIFNYLTN